MPEDAIIGYLQQHGLESLIIIWIIFNQVWPWLKNTLFPAFAERQRKLFDQMAIENDRYEKLTTELLGLTREVTVAITECKNVLIDIGVALKDQKELLDELVNRKTQRLEPAEDK